MALFTRRWPCTQLTALLLSMTTRMLQLDFLGRDADSVRRRRVFWIAYIMEAELNLNCGLPPSQPEPDVPPPDGLVAADLAGGFLTTGKETEKYATVFLHRASLAVVQYRIAKQLFTGRGLSSKDEKVLDEISTLATELDAWRAAMPEDIRPSHDLTQSNTVALDGPVTVMHLVYFNCLCLVHWAARRFNTPSIMPVDDRRHRTLSKCRETCQSAARLSILLVGRSLSKLRVLDLWYVFTGSSVVAICPRCGARNLTPASIQEGPLLPHNRQLRPRNIRCGQPCNSGCMAEREATLGACHLSQNMVGAKRT